MKKRVVIIEDQTDLLQSFNLIIGNTGRYEIIGLYANAEEAIPKY